MTEVLEVVSCEGFMADGGQELGGDVVDDDPETFFINEELHRMISLEVQTSGIQLSEQ